MVTDDSLIVSHSDMIDLQKYYIDSKVAVIHTDMKADDKTEQIDIFIYFFIFLAVQ